MMMTTMTKDSPLLTCHCHSLLLDLRCSASPQLFLVPTFCTAKITIYHSGIMQICHVLFVPLKYIPNVNRQLFSVGCMCYRSDNKIHKNSYKGMYPQHSSGFKKMTENSKNNSLFSVIFLNPLVSVYVVDTHLFSCFYIYIYCWCSPTESCLDPSLVPLAWYSWN